MSPEEDASPSDEGASATSTTTNNIGGGEIVNRDRRKPSQHLGKLRRSNQKIKTSRT